MDGSYDKGSSESCNNVVGSMSDSDEVPDRCIKLEYTKKDMDKLRAMWDEIFSDPEAFAVYYFREVCSENKILVAYEGEEPVGMVHLNNYRVSAYGKETDCTYVVGVCVKKEYRNRGIMKVMMQRVIDDWESGRDGFVFLMPKEQVYYTGLGFKSIYETCILECNILYEDMVEERCFKDFETLGLGIIDMSEYDDQALAILAYRINEYFARDYKVFSVRTVEYLKRMLKEHLCQNGNVSVVKWGSDKLLGLFSYDIYDGILYAERVEFYDGNLNDMLTCIVRKCIEFACVGCVVTLPAKLVSKADINISGMDIQIKEGHGIMAYVKPDNAALTMEMLQGHSFFDEIV